MALFMRKTLLALKIEDTEGSAETLTGTECFLIRNATLTPLAGNTAERQFVRETFGNYGTIQLDQHVELTFEVEFSPSGAAGTAPAYADALLACGLDEATSNGVSVTYTPLSSDFDSATIEVYMDGIKHQMTGCRGNVSLNLARGSLPTLNFTFMGSYTAPADATPLTPDFTGWQVPLGPNSLNTATVQLHGIDVCMESISIDLANQTTFRDLPGCDPKALITDRKPSGSIVFEMTDVDTYAWVEAARTHVVDDLSIVHGNDAGYIITIAAPAVSFQPPSFTDSDGIMMCSMPLAFEPTSAGNDEISIAYT
jgi:hypothetical protein